MSDPRLERDYYRKLLELGGQDALEPLLGQALDLMLEITGARQGVLELGTAAGQAPRWRLSRGLDGEALEGFARASRGVIDEALAAGAPVQSACAIEDPRFAGRQSVVEQGLQAVLCVPVGAPPLGVVYLQDRATPGPFSTSDLGNAALLARQLGALADRLLLRADREAADPTLPWRRRLGEVALVGRSPAFAELLRQLSMAAPLDIDVLISGPSGSGKSAVAELLARASPRRRGPFVALNCAALPVELVESELFGAERGAHSTATRAMPGKIAAAEGGTLFLDEIAELPLPAQAKLLQLLQERQYWPLGSPRPRRADVRVIAATHADLDALVRERRFRDDLRYRLTVFTVRCPGLDERAADLPLLAEAFLEAAATRHRLPRLELSAAALAAVCATPWPGHVRQLSHALESALVRAAAEGALRVGPEHVFPEAAPAELSGLDYAQSTRHVRHQLLREALDACDWNVSEAARRLGLARSHVYTLMRDAGLRRPGGPSGTAAR